MEDIRARFVSVVYREHALWRMFERGVGPREVAEAITDPNAEVIESYPNAPEGPCCLVLGRTTSGRPLHTVLGLRGPLCVISVYDPSADPQQRWSDDFRRRT